MSPCRLSFSSSVVHTSVRRAAHAAAMRAQTASGCMRTHRFSESRKGQRAATNGPSGRLAGELDHAAGPEDRSLEGLPRLHRADALADLRKIGVALDRDTRHRQDDVSTNHDLLSAD